MNIYVAVGPGVVGDLTDQRAMNLESIFSAASWNSFDEFTTMFFNVSILRRDLTRPEGFNCTCCKNAKEFTCIHSLGVAPMRGTTHPPAAAVVQLLGR